ncbi:sensor histidine kinase [Nonomuraea sp. NPDC050404]|uniref:sensor histidine kinase n=1 Tax=Nonomuraea sp. NPDC050404 TaxID=3155783 RepID=UPI0033F6F5BB
MRQARSIRDLTRWVRFSDGRPPAVFNVIFWGSAGLLALSFFAQVQAVQQAAAGRLLVYQLYYGMGLALLVVAALWPFLSWRSEAPALRHKAVSVVFLIATLPLWSGGISGTLIVGLAMANALVILGLRGVVGYTGVVGLLAFVISLLNPGRSVIGMIADSVVVVLLCLLIIAIVVAMLEFSRQAEETRRVLAELEQAHAELERHASRSRELAIAEERARMSRDMHDSVGHYLTVINMSLQNAQRYRTVRPDSAWEEVKQAQTLTLEALTDTRRWVRALKPLRMDGLTGPAALRALVESFGSADTGVSFRLIGAWPDVDENRELVCYRVVQEGLTNAMRHSGARHVEVALDCTAERVEVRVSDDGTGAAPGATAHGFGLRGLRDRLRGVGGELDVSGDSGSGFTLRATVPV